MAAYGSHYRDERQGRAKRWGNRYRAASFGALARSARTVSYTHLDVYKRQVGTLFTDWANDGVFGDGWLYAGTEQYDDAVGAWEESMAAAEAAGAGAAELAALAEEEPDPAAFGVYIPGLTPVATEALESIGTAPWLTSLVVDGIIAGVGAVLGFVPQMIVLFLLLSVLCLLYTSRCV